MEKLKKNPVFKASYILIALVFSFYLGLNWGKEGLNNNLEYQPLPAEDLDLSLFWETWDMIKDKYVNFEEVDRNNLVLGAIRGLVESLNDPHSYFLSPQEAKGFNQDLEGSFNGIGAEIGSRDGFLIIISPLAGMPAEAAGLLPGDKIIKINQDLTAKMSLSEAVSLIRGSKGTKVTLTILRETGPWEVNIIRSRIDVPSVSWEMKPERIVYINLDNFNEDVQKEFIVALGQIMPFGPKAIILDLRNNPGGFLERAIDIVSWFVNRGEVVLIEEKRDEIIEHTARGSADLRNIPLVVLVNQGSASASEIVAGALRDIRGIKLEGERTFGKGSVQSLENLNYGAQLRISIARWLTPQGHSIQDQGLEPDLKVEMTLEDATFGRDPQLDAALQILQN